MLQALGTNVGSAASQAWCACAPRQPGRFARESALAERRRSSRTISHTAVGVDRGHHDGLWPDLYRRLVGTRPRVAVVDAQHPSASTSIRFKPDRIRRPNWSGASTFLAGDDREQDGRHRLREALKLGSPAGAAAKLPQRRPGILERDDDSAVARHPRPRHPLVGHHRDAGERLIDPSLRGIR